MELKELLEKLVLCDTRINVAVMDGETFQIDLSKNYKKSDQYMDYWFYEVDSVLIYDDRLPKIIIKEVEEL